jgi:CheY-like chemotaxis protein
MAFKTALVVDDSKSARFALRRFLENHYYKVETAEGAEESYNLLKQYRPDVIFLDHVMPGIDGLSALRHIKSNPATEDLQVVICSSNEGEDFERQAQDGGAAGVLHKPPSAEQLARILNHLRNPVAVAPPAPVPTPSKVANIREPDVAIEQRVMKTLRSSLASPPPAAMAAAPSALNEVAQSLSVQIAQLQQQAAQLQTRIDEEQTVATQQPDFTDLAAQVEEQKKRIDRLELLVEENFSELHATLDASLREQVERIEQIAAAAQAAAQELAREEAERTVMNAAARISDQLASAILSALHGVALNPLAPRTPAESSLSEKTGRQSA